MGHFVNSSVNNWDTHTGYINQSPSVSSTANSPEDTLWECFCWWTALVKIVIAKSPLNQDLFCDHTSLFHHRNTFLPALKLAELAQTELMQHMEYKIFFYHFWATSKYDARWLLLLPIYLMSACLILLCIPWYS